MAAATLLQAALDTGHTHGNGVAGWLHRFADLLLNFFKPLGIWGLAGICLLDSALIPLPWQGLLIFDVHAYPSRYLVYPLVAAIASAIGSLVPYFAGRLGGELFLLGKINRVRYERLRDRFERQEFLAILLPAMGPPPTPIKLFEFCAGVFEMKPFTFLLAMFLGKLIQFVVLAVLLHVYGPGTLQLLSRAIHHHSHLMLTLVGLLLLAICIWVVRKLFDRRAPILPLEEQLAAQPGTTTIVDE